MLSHDSINSICIYKDIYNSIFFILQTRTKTFCTKLSFIEITIFHKLLLSNKKGYFNFITIRTYKFT